MRINLWILLKLFLRHVNDLLWLIALRFEITIFLGIPRDFRMFHNSFCLPMLSESFSSKNACFFAAINFGATYVAFLCNYLSIWSLVFLNVWKSLSLDLSFSNTSPSIQSWVFPLTRLVLGVVYMEEKCSGRRVIAVDRILFSFYLHETF